MKSSRRRPSKKVHTPKSLAEHFQEWQKLRIKVTQAELADERNKTTTEAKRKGSGRGSRKPSGPSRSH